MNQIVLTYILGYAKDYTDKIFEQIKIIGMYYENIKDK